MQQITQAEADAVVARIRKAMPWIKPRLGKDKRADDVEHYYKMFYALPEYVAFLLLGKALDVVEAEIAAESKA